MEWLEFADGRLKVEYFDDVERDGVLLNREGEICLTLVIEEDEPRDPVEMVFRLLFRAAFEGVTVPRLGTGLTVLRIGAAGVLNRVDEPPRL